MMGLQHEKHYSMLVWLQVTRSEPSFSGNVGLQRPAFTAAPPVILSLERPAIESVSTTPPAPTEQVTGRTP